MLLYARIKVRMYVTPFKSVYVCMCVCVQMFVRMYVKRRMQLMLGIGSVCRVQSDNPDD